MDHVPVHIAPLRIFFLLRLAGPPWLFADCVL
jgi:hypothetical protein